jgi:hypothetical protein
MFFKYSNFHLGICVPELQNILGSVGGPIKHGEEWL